MTCSAARLQFRKFDHFTKAALNRPATQPATQAPVSELARLRYTFTAPSTTFVDLKRDPSWWAPWLVAAVLSLVFAFAIQERVGFEQLARNEVATSPQDLQELQSMSAEEREQQLRFSAVVYKWFFYASPLWVLVFGSLIALALWTTLNYGMNAEIKYETTLAVVFYAMIPQSVLDTLVLAWLWKPGFRPESFNLANPTPTNLAAFMDYQGSSKALYELATGVDILNIWTVVLLGIGLSTVTTVKRSAALRVVGLWYAGVILAFALLAVTFP